jgi:hypothetical protein
MMGRRVRRGPGGRAATLLRRARGGVAVLVLGAVLLPLLVLLGLGLAEGARAKAYRTSARRSLAAAVQGAARVEPAQQEAVFRQVLVANLGAGASGGGPAVVRAWLERGAAPGANPASDAGPFLTGRLTVTYRLEYLAPWLPPLSLEFTHSEPLPNRKAAP